MNILFATKKLRDDYVDHMLKLEGGTALVPSLSDEIEKVTAFTMKDNEGRSLRVNARHGRSIPLVFESDRLLYDTNKARLYHAWVEGVSTKIQVFSQEDRILDGVGQTGERFRSVIRDIKTRVIRLRDDILYDVQHNTLINQRVTAMIQSGWKVLTHDGTELPLIAPFGNGSPLIDFTHPLFIPTENKGEGSGFPSPQHKPVITPLNVPSKRDEDTPTLSYPVMTFRLPGAHSVMITSANGQVITLSLKDVTLAVTPFS